MPKPQVPILLEHAATSMHSNYAYLFLVLVPFSYFLLLAMHGCAQTTTIL